MWQNEIKGPILVRIEVSFLNTSGRHAPYANLSKCLRKLADTIPRAIFEKKKNPKHSTANTQIIPEKKNPSILFQFVLQWDWKCTVYVVCLGSLFHPF